MCILHRLQALVLGGFGHEPAVVYRVLSVLLHGTSSEGLRIGLIKRPGECFFCDIPAFISDVTEEITSNGRILQWALLIQTMCRTCAWSWYEKLPNRGMRSRPVSSQTVMLDSQSIRVLHNNRTGTAG